MNKAGVLYPNGTVRPGLFASWAFGGASTSDLSEAYFFFPTRF
ncbi:MAG: hypothetical protein R3Y61_00265 [Rikenellaceae bacterium]